LRLLLGVIILVVLVIGYLFPSEFTYSLLTSETDKEKPLQKLQVALEKISNAEPDPSDPEKLKLEKLIIKSQQKINNLLMKKARGEKLTKKEKFEEYFEDIHYTTMEKE
ncbi:427_t:CDS:1, partial [Ambispora gerdemannii]